MNSTESVLGSGQLKDSDLGPKLVRKGKNFIKLKDLQYR